MTDLNINFVRWESNAEATEASIRESGGSVASAASPWDIPADLIDEYSDGQIEPLMIIAAAVSIGFLIKVVSSVVADHTRPGGQVVDARGDTVTVRPAPHLERGTLVVISSEGAKVIKTKDEVEISEALIAALANA